MRQEKLELIREAVALGSKAWVRVSWVPGDHEDAQRVMSGLLRSHIHADKTEAFYRWALPRLAAMALESEEPS